LSFSFCLQEREADCSRFGVEHKAVYMADPELEVVHMAAVVVVSSTVAASSRIAAAAFAVVGFRRAAAPALATARAVR